ncbi:MAG: hypothetical protein J7L55_02855 [Desulfurococcales archaeon]|nr:hypothetical protein [Desulfurococcales archaeon]
MKVTFADARVWRYTITAMSKFIDTAVLTATDDFLSVKGIDPSKTALLEFTIPRSAFETYDIDADTKLQLNLDEVGKIMRSAERDDKITIEADGSSIKLTFEKRGVPRTFRLPLQMEELQEIPELSLDLDNVFEMSGEVLYEAITGLEDVGEVLWVKGEEGVLRLSSESDLSEAEIVLSLDKGVLGKAEVKNPGFSVSYGMEYFTYIKQPLRVSDTAIIKADADMPIKLELSFIEGAKLNYYVAPRAE